MSQNYKKFEGAVLQLLNINPFYGQFLLRSNRIADSTITTPLAFTIGQSEINILINYDLLELRTVDDIVYQLSHVIYHILLLHPYRRGGRDSQRWGVATDIVVNQLNKFPNLMIDTPGYQPEDFKLKKDGTADQYYEHIPPDTPDKSIDDHTVWAKSEAVPESIAKQNVKSVASEAAKNCGNIPGDLRDIIKDLLEDQRLDWRELLSMFLASSQTTTKRLSWSKRSRRFSDSPGSKKKNQPKILIGIDTSGSISDVQQRALVTEVRNASECKEAKIIVAGYDTRVHTILRLTDGDDLRIPNTNGGTDFQGLITLAETEDPDAIINLTDGYAPTPKETQYPYLWIYTKDHQKHEGYGESIVMEDV